MSTPATLQNVTAVEQMNVRGVRQRFCMRLRLLRRKQNTHDSCVSVCNADMMESTMFRKKRETESRGERQRFRRRFQYLVKNEGLGQRGA